MVKLARRGQTHQRIRSRVQRLPERALRVALKDGSEHVAVLSRDNYAAKALETGPADAKVYSASFTVITETDMEIEIDLLDVTSIDACPERDVAMQAILRSRRIRRR